MYSRIAVVNVKNLPVIAQESLLDVLGERNGGVTIDGDICFGLSLIRQSEGSRGRRTIVIIDLVQ